MIRTTTEVPIHDGECEFWTLHEGPPRTGNYIAVKTSPRWRGFGYVTLVVQSTEYCIHASELHAAIDNAMNDGRSEAT